MCQGFYAAEALFIEGNVAVFVSVESNFSLAHNSLLMKLAVVPQLTMADVVQVTVCDGFDARFAKLFARNRVSHSYKGIVRIHAALFRGEVVYALSVLGIYQASRFSSVWFRCWMHTYLVAIR